jgi:hypothetical protein
MEAKFYKNKVIFMLTDDAFYKEIPENQDKKTLKKIKHPLKHMDTTSFTTKRNGFFDRFCLPKIHKS